MMEDKEIDKYAKCIHRLSALEKLYQSNSDDLFELERIKREILAELSFLGYGYAEAKVYKSGAHVYLEEERKYLKARVTKSIIGGEVKFSMAEKLVYQEPEYKTQLEEINKKKKRLLSIETSYHHFEKVLDCIIQSISVLSKEMHLHISSKT